MHRLRQEALPDTVLFKRAFWPAILALGLSSCGDVGSIDSPSTEPPTTLGSAIIDDTPIQPAEITDGDLSVVIRVAKGFCCNPLTLEFTADVSDAFAASTSSFAWDFGNGKQGTQQVANHTFDWTGDYTVRVVVTDVDGKTTEAQATFSLGLLGLIDGSVSQPDEEPRDDQTDLDPEDESTDESTPSAPDRIAVTADAGADLVAAPGDTVVLAGTGGGAEAGLSFEWSQTFGMPVNLLDPETPTASFVVPDGSDRLTFQLRVAVGGESATDSVNVIVDSLIDPASHTVTADAGLDTTVEGGATVILNGSSSIATGDGPITYHWSQLSGTGVTLTESDRPVANFVAPQSSAEASTLVFQLTVSQESVSDADQVSITIPAQESPAEPDEAQILSWMQELPPLQKVTYSFSTEASLLVPPVQPMLYELTRICNAVSITGRAPKRHNVQAAVLACKQVNATNPAIPATIAINFSPWHEVFPREAPPTDFGPDHDAEIELFQTNLAQLLLWLNEANLEHQTNVTVSALVLDSERFITKKPEEEGYLEWNSAMNAKYDAIYLIGRQFLPNVRIEMFGRGAIQPCTNLLNFCAKTLYTLEELGDNFNCALYIPPETDLMIETFRRTYQSALQHGYSDVTVWVSLAAGWRSTGPKSRVWEISWDYDTQFSWNLGAQINDPYYGDRPAEFANWHAAERVVLHPKAFDPRAPHWGKHFVAYVRGAHGINELP